MGLHGIKKLLHNKKMFFKFKRLLTGWEKIFACHISDKGLITRIYREFKKSKLPQSQLPNEEMGKCTEWILFKGRSPNG
jgi:hypothetical protein